MRTHLRHLGLLAAGVGALLALTTPAAAFDGDPALRPAPRTHQLQLAFDTTGMSGARLELAPAAPLVLDLTAKTDRERRKWLAPTLGAIALALISSDNSTESLFFVASLVGIVLYMDEPAGDGPPALPDQGLGVTMRHGGPNLQYQMRW